MTTTVRTVSIWITLLVYILELKQPIVHSILCWIEFFVINKELMKNYEGVRNISAPYGLLELFNNCSLTKLCQDNSLTLQIFYFLFDHYFKTYVRLELSLGLGLLLWRWPCAWLWPFWTGILTLTWNQTSTLLSSMTTTTSLRGIWV